MEYKSMEWKNGNSEANRRLFLKIVWFIHYRKIQFLIKHKSTNTNCIYIYTNLHTYAKNRTATAHSRLCPQRRKNKGEASHTWTYWDWPQLQPPGAAGLICWQGPQRLHCGSHHSEFACVQHAGSWGMMEEWEIQVSVLGRQEVGLSELLAVVLLRLESAGKRDGKCSKTKAKGKTNNR